MLQRRTLAAALLGGCLALAAGWTGGALAADGPAAFRIGYQKTGVLVVARQQRILETRLGAEGIAVAWTEFTSGPPLLEAINAGAIDLGLTGDTPPIFAQAAGAAITYVAALPPNGPGEAIIVKADSPIRDVADLAGKRLALKRGSSANNLAVAALEAAGVPWASVSVVDLSPADAAAAFDGDDVDAWAIWDPFFAAAEQRYHPRVLVTSAEAVQANTFLIAGTGFAADHPDLVREVVACLGESAEWAEAHRGELAQALHAVTGVDLAALERAAGRASFYIRPLDEEIVAHQQATADRFAKLGLIPRPIRVRDAVWKPSQS